MSLLAKEFDARSLLHGQVSLAAVNEVTGRTFQVLYVLQSLDIVVAIVNSAGPDKMPHMWYFILPKYPIKGFMYTCTKGLRQMIRSSLWYM